MEIFQLPKSAKLYRVIPKNSFDSFSTPKQRSMLSSKVARIIWQYKLSPETINLEANDIDEIQIISIELKEKDPISSVLELIEKSIPYHLILIVHYAEEYFLSTSIKHKHPLNEDNAVIDWAFKTDWLNPIDNPYSLRLSRSLDAVYMDFCLQLFPSYNFECLSIYEFAEIAKQIAYLEKKVAELKNRVAHEHQFNKKVALNLELHEQQNSLNKFLKRTNAAT